MERWCRINFQPSIPTGEDGRRLTGSQKHIDLSRKAATEGMVLLKNENSILPVAPGKKIAVFGRGQYDYIKGGGGSGVVSSAYTRSIYEGLQIKAEEGKICLFEPVSQFYVQELQEECTFLNALDRKVYARERLINGIGSQEPAVPETLMAEAAAFTDTAFIIISRYSCEKYERSARPDGGDFYLSVQEQDMVRRVCEHFAHIVIILNVGGIMDVSWFADNPAIEGALLAWQSGMEGGLAVADVLCGDITPSGKLTDTFARSYSDYPSAAGFMESDDYVNYTEDIYVGYRYFETIPGAAHKVIYGFGYGLSYTSFAISAVRQENQGTSFTISCTVTNTGKTAGKEVIQIYAQAPQGILGKPARELAAFAKTELLQPGGSQTLTMAFDLTQIASYDDLGKLQKSAFLLEAGTYAIYLGNSLRSAQKIAEYDLPQLQIVEQLCPRGVPQLLQERMRADGSMEALPAGTPAAPVVLTEFAPYCAEKSVTIYDVVDGSITLDQFVGSLSDEDLAWLLFGHNTVSVSPTNGIGGGGRKSKFCIPLLPTADGPAGLRIPPEVGIFTTAFPCATQLACTWDPALIRQVGTAIASEVHENNIAVYLAPALNIHRDPLCGRNYEYYSEDPYLSGKMATAAVQGIQSLNIAATVKHFACNGKETNRRNSDSRLSERALREIYLRGFQMVVKEAAPWALMTAYNKINGVRASAQGDLINGILREEWGFQGLVMTDWHVLGSQVDELLAGNDVKMPEALMLPENEWYKLEDYVRSGKLPRGVLQHSAKRVLELILRME